MTPTTWKIGLGCMRLSTSPDRDDARAILVIHAALDAGVTLLERPGVVRLLESCGLRAGASRYYFFFPRFLAALRPLERWLGWVPFGGQFFVVGER